MNAIPKYVVSRSLSAEEAGQLQRPVELLQGDATAIPLPSGQFDLTHARTVLLNVSDPEAILREMIRITRPRGIIALQEPDSGSWVCDPPHPSWDVVRSAVTTTYARNGKDFDIGRRVGRLLRTLGLTDVRVRPTARATRAGDFYQTFLLTIAELIADGIVACGLLAKDGLAEPVAELRAHLSDPDTITLQPIVWQAWAIKPGDE